MSSKEVDEALADEAEELDGYFSDAPLDPRPNYPPLDEGFDNCVVITNLPQVPESKLEKLTKVVSKIVTKIGTVVAAAASSSDEDGPSSSAFDGVYMPYDAEKDRTLGFCMVEYETAEQAKNAVDVLQGYKFDKNHALRTTLYSRARALRGVPDREFTEPPPPPFEEGPNATEWLRDSLQRDEFVVRYGKETAVYWYDAKNDPVVDYDGEREKEAGLQWCEYYCHWSPAGSYLATLVPARGVILWSGSSYEKTGRLVAPGVKHVLFSPRENYVITSNENPNDPAAVKVYHVPTGNLLRAFPLYPDKVPRDGPPPPFLWSHDDQYLARMGDGLISVYEAPSMRLLDKKSLLADGVCEFQWSPKANVLAYWAPEAINSPAHVDLIEIPSRKKLRQKNLFNVTRCNMVFHPQGDYLAVKVTRHTKTKKTHYNNIELFRLSEASGAAGGGGDNVPVEMLDTKDAVLALTWEPRGSRFAMIHAESPTSAKVKVSFYDMKKRVAADAAGGVVGLTGGPAKAGKKGGGAATKVVSELNLVETLEGRQCNTLFWSPAGSTIIMASLGEAASGTLEFYDVDSRTMVVKEHYRCTHVQWDPAGRTVATAVAQPLEGSSFKFAMDNGYIIWSFQGKQLYQQSFEAFYQFLWRPRESLLSRSEIEKVRKNLKKYEKQFDKADRKRQRALYLEETKGKRAERAKFREVLARNRAIRQRNRAEHVALLGGYDSEDENNYVVRDLVVETILTSKDEVVM